MKFQYITLISIDLLSLQCKSFPILGMHNFRRRRQDLFNAMGSMYAAVLFMGIQNATSVQPVVAVERTVFYREKAAGMYSPLSYAFAQVMTNSFNCTILCNNYQHYRP